MKYILFLVLLFFSFGAIAQKQSKSDSIKMLSEQVQKLQSEVEGNKSELDAYKNLLSITNGSISNQLSSTSIALYVFAFIVAVGGFLLGLWINNSAINAKKVLKDVSLAKEETEKIKILVQEQSDKINSNLAQLYEDLQDEEFKSNLDYLAEFPEKLVDNSGSFLTRKEIPKKYLPKVIEVLEKNTLYLRGIVLRNFIAHFGWKYFLDNQNLIKLYNKGFSDDTVKANYGISIEDAIEVINLLKIKFSMATLTESDLNFLNLAVLPLSKQIDFHPNLVYEVFIKHFGEDFYTKYGKLHLTVDDFKNFFMEFLKIEPYKYKKDDIAQLIEDFDKYLEKAKRDVYDKSSFSRSQIIEGLVRQYENNPEFFKQ